MAPERSPVLDEIVPVPTTGRVFRGEALVRLGDVDTTGVARLDAVARHVQDVAADDSGDAAVVDLHPWVVRRTTLVATTLPVLNEGLALATFCSGHGARWAERRVSITGERGASVEVVALWVLLDRTTGRPRRLPDGFHDVWGATAGGRTVSARLRHGRPDDSGDVRPWTWRAVDLDVLGHVNNAAYWAAVEQTRRENGGPAAPLVADVEFRAEAGEECERIVASADHGFDQWLVEGGAVVASARVRPLA